MALKQTEWATGQRATASACRAGDAMVMELTYTIKDGETLASTDKVELGLLPAFHHIVNATLVNDALGGTTTLDVGIMSGSVGEKDDTRTVGNELFDGADVATAAATPMTSATGFRLESTDNHRSIGMTPSANVSASGSDLAVTLVVVYAPSSN